MKIKKIVSSVLALSMTMSMACTTAFAFDSDDISEQSTFIYTDKLLQTYEDIATTESSVSGDYVASMNLSESDDELDPEFIGYIRAKSNPLITITDSVSDIDILGYYKVTVCTSDYYDYEVVDELLVLLSGLTLGDRVIMAIEDNEDNLIALGTIDGNVTAGAYITFPANSGEYYISVYKASAVDGGTGDNSNTNYTLQVASRYVRETQQFYADSSISYSGYGDWSYTGYMTIKESAVPRSAIVDSLFVNGTLYNTKTGKAAYVNILTLSNGDKEIAGSCPYTFNDVKRFEIPLAGTWEIRYTPYLNKDNPHVLNNFTASIDYTYDILDV